MLSVLIACHDCDLLQYKIALAPGSSARCVRCSATLYRRPRHRIDYPIAWAITAVALFIIANAFPVLSLQIQGRETSTTLLGAALTMQDQGMPLVAALVLGTTVIAPALGLVAMLYVLIPLRFGRLMPGFVALTRLLQTIAPWAMIEVFVLGLLVSLVKLQHLATVIPGIGLWAFIALMLTSVAATATYDPHLIWQHIADLDTADDIV
ncbi:MAG: paraquat-inducible protein A [Gammaproteobacteria bacterium]|nr:paraquat-inducible protein A [Gammaproteobacteria bacterium]